MNDQIKYGIVGAFVGGIVIWLLMTTVVSPNKTGMMGNIDQHFIEQMIPHHEDAITMANMALKKATHDEIKILAQDIITSQQSEIDKMKTWYKDWYGNDVPQDEKVMGGHGMQKPQGMHMGMMGDVSDMTRLEQATDFDKAFVEEMIPHHQMAVMMASMLKNGTNRPEMKKLADDITTAQTNEIDQMRGWLIEWEK
ncbi:MAG: DUF305 domain-containing protein [bacterium]|nr:DUF305 domain-containing protein [bacterium]